MVEPTAEVPIQTGMQGISIDAIEAGKKGFVLLPLGPVDPSIWGGRKLVRVRVTAMEKVRAWRDIIVGNLQREIKEHTPVEISYQLEEGGYQRVGELFPFPVTMASQAIEHETIEATAAGNTVIITPASGKKIRIHWYGISNSHNIIAEVGLRFGASGDIKHKHALAADGGTVTPNLTGAAFEGAEDEVLYAWLGAAYASGVFFNIAYTEE